MSYADKNQNRDRYRRLRREGICGQCGRIPSKFALCAFCRAERNTQRRGRKRVESSESRRKRYDAARAKGLCTCCGLPSTERARCSTCQAKDSESRRKRRNATAVPQRARKQARSETREAYAERISLLRALQSEVAQ